MTKQDLIKQAALDANITQAEASTVVDSFLSSIGTALQQDGKLILRDFGTFSLLAQKERPGRNPHTGASLIVPAKNLVKFKVSEALKKIVN